MTRTTDIRERVAIAFWLMLAGSVAIALTVGLYLGWKVVHSHTCAVRAQAGPVVIGREWRQAADTKCRVPFEGAIMQERDSRKL